MTNNDDKPKVGLSSVEAAALYLSEGQTTDPIKASHLAAGNPFNMDGLQRAHLRRMMGFDFSIDVDETENTITVKSNEGPEIVKTGTYDGVIDEAAVDTLVDLCMELKVEWDEANSPVEGEVVETEDNV